MSSPREFMDCRECYGLQRHTRKAGCVLAVQDAAEANESIVEEFTGEYQLARDVLTMAANGHMPDTYWLSDRRISRAAKVLGLSNEDAREWAEQEIERDDDD
jgi:hypothetical protein